LEKLPTWEWEIFEIIILKILKAENPNRHLSLSSNPTAAVTRRLSHDAGQLSMT
jgi:hypothetical protein